MVRRWAVIFMLVATCGVACGGLDYLHRCQHVKQAQAWAAGMRALAERAGNKADGRGPSPVGRDDGSCVVCQMLHAPIAAQGVAPSVVSFALLSAAVLNRPPVLMMRRVFLHVDLRGPPLG